MLEWREWSDICSFSVGVDSEQLKWGQDDEINPRSHRQSLIEPTIEEDKLEEDGHETSTPSPTLPRHVKRNSYHRLSRLSDEARMSIQSISSTPEKNGTNSNRSSMTIRAVQVNGNGGLNDDEFENALRKFASERESFLADLSISAGAVLANRAKARPKTQKIVNEDGTGLSSGAGSIRRRISFRDMGSMKRQPSVVRQGMLMALVCFCLPLLF